VLKGVELKPLCTKGASPARSDLLLGGGGKVTNQRSIYPAVAGGGVLCFWRDSRSLSTKKVINQPSIHSEEKAIKTGCHRSWGEKHKRGFTEAVGKGNAEVTFFRVWGTEKRATGRRPS